MSYLMSLVALVEREIEERDMLGMLDISWVTLHLGFEKQSVSKESILATFSLKV